MASITDFAALAQRMAVLGALGNAIGQATTAELQFVPGDTSGLGRQRVVSLFFDDEAKAKAFLETAQRATKQS